VLLYRLAKAGRVRVPLVFVDSPLATQASEVTFRHLEALDELAHEFHLAQRAESCRLRCAIRRMSTTRCS